MWTALTASCAVHRIWGQSKQIKKCTTPLCLTYCNITISSHVLLNSSLQPSHSLHDHLCPVGSPSGLQLWHTAQAACPVQVCPFLAESRPSRLKFGLKICIPFFLGKSLNMCSSLGAEIEWSISDWKITALPTCVLKCHWVRHQTPHCSWLL